MNIFSRNAGNLPARGSSKGGSSRRAQLQTGTTVLLATSAAVATLWPAAIGRCPATHGSCSLSSAACMSACQPGPGMCINNTHCDVQHALRCRHGARDAQSVAIVYGEVDLNAEERELLTSKWCQLRSTARVH